MTIIIFFYNLTINYLYFIKIFKDKKNVEIKF